MSPVLEEHLQGCTGPFPAWIPPSPRAFSPPGIHPHRAAFPAGEKLLEGPAAWGVLGGGAEYPTVPLSSPSPSCHGLCWLWGLDVLGPSVWVLCAFNLGAKLYCKT